MLSFSYVCADTIITDSPESGYIVQRWPDKSIPFLMQATLIASSTIDKQTSIHGDVEVEICDVTHTGNDSTALDSYKPQVEIPVMESINPATMAAQHCDVQISTKQARPEQKWAPRSSLSLRSRHGASLQASVVCPQGKMVPQDHALLSLLTQPEAQPVERIKGRDQDNDSVSSVIRNADRKNLAHWFSGLLSR